MAGKHKRVLRDGQIARGPARWARAAANALEKPNSRAGQQYLRRVSFAYQVADECRNSMDVDAMQAYEHIELDWRTRHRDGVDKGRRKYVTCSVFCTVMQIQLDHPEGSLENISAVFSTNHQVYRGRDSETGGFIMADSGVPKVRPLVASTLKRTSRCQYCGTQVGGK